MANVSPASRAIMSDSPVPSTGTSRTSTPGISTPTPTAAAEKMPDDSSRLKTLLSLLKKFIGVADIASVRLSLPAQLMEPIPNLEYWQYLDRPETFASIGKSDDEVGRMLEVLRFWFTKDLKYVKGKPCKPYNSTLGEIFRCNWEIQDEPPGITMPSQAPEQPPQDPLQPPVNASNAAEPVRISYLTEQTSHHPPVSAWWASCPARGLFARGYDQLSAKFTGTAVRVTPGVYNKGIFITLTHRDNEEYQLTHPAAFLGGLLRGNLAVSVSDTCFIKCPKTRLKAILLYADEGWVGKNKNLVQGVVYKYNPDDDTVSKIKDVPEKDIVARVEGCWQEQIYYTIPSTEAVKKDPKAEPTSQKQLLIDVVPLMPVPKIVPPPEEQLSNESRKYWQEVTTTILARQFGEATKAKQEIEQRQRDKAAEREKNGVVWKPRFFTAATEPDGRPQLTEEGKQLLEGMQSLSFHLDEKETAS